MFVWVQPFALITNDMQFGGLFLFRRPRFISLHSLPSKTTTIGVDNTEEDGPTIQYKEANSPS